MSEGSSTERGYLFRMKEEDRHLVCTMKETKHPSRGQ